MVLHFDVAFAVEVVLDISLVHSFTISIYRLIFRSAEVLFATGIGSKGGAYSG